MHFSGHHAKYCTSYRLMQMCSESENSPLQGKKKSPVLKAVIHKTSPSMHRRRDEPGGNKRITSNPLTMLPDKISIFRRACEVHMSIIYILVQENLMFMEKCNQVIAVFYRCLYGVQQRNT